MKVTVVVLACMAFAGITANSVPPNVKHVDKAYLDKQRFLYEILYRVDDPLMFEEYIKLGQDLIVDKSLYTAFDETMFNFYNQYEMGSILPRGEFFSAIHKIHSKQGLGLFGFFYNAKDWATFVHNVAWARSYVNEGMFVYALTLAIIHRPDTRGLTLPPIYEILPQMFLNSKYIVKGKEFDAGFFNTQTMLKNELGPVYKQKYASKIFKERFFLKDWKVWQWWNLMGLDQDWHLEEKTIMKNNFEAFQNDPQFKALFKDTKFYWMPVDYTRDIGIYNEETKLSYFTEDIGLNAYWYYLNMRFAYSLDGPKFNDERVEFFFFAIQNLLARYYLERLSVGMGSIGEFSKHGIVKNGYDPQLIDYNGNGFTSRTDYFNIYSHESLFDLNNLEVLKYRMENAVESGKYVTSDGKVIDLTDPTSVGYIGDLMQGNVDNRDKQFYRYWYPFACIFFSDRSLKVSPNVGQNFETILRDPFTYILYKYIFGFYLNLKGNFQPYTSDQVQVNSLKVYDAEISNLMTYFDLFDIDVSTLLKDKMIFHDGKFVWDKTLLARQLRLNHKPFNLQIKVKSEIAQKVVVRIFLAPVFDEFGKHIDLFTNTQNFIMMDKFPYELTAGDNVIVRNSKDIAYTANDYTTYTELYKYVMLGYEGGSEYPLGVGQQYCKFPQRLILPRGWVSGMPMKVIFFLSPYTGKTSDPVTNDYFSCNIGAGDLYLDDLPFGYPFDRKIENINKFFGPNMLVKDAKIYHTEKYEKYYPNKYENFGTFDYSF